MAAPFPSVEDASFLLLEMHMLQFSEWLNSCSPENYEDLGSIFSQYQCQWMHTIF